MEEFVLEALGAGCEWFVLQEGDRIIGCISRSTLYKRVKDGGFPKSLDFPLEELIIDPVFITGEGELQGGEWENQKVFLLREENGEINGVIDWEINEGISDQVASDAWILKEFETVFYDFYHNILVTDGEGNVIRATSEDDQQYIGRNVFDLEKEREFYPSVTAKVLKTGKRERGLQYTKSGEVFTIESAPIKNAKGKIVRVVSITKESSGVDDLMTQLEEVRSLLNSYREEVLTIRQEREKRKSFVYASKEMENLNSMIKTVSSVDTTVLILGETGVGKEVIAKQIHKNSNRNDRPMLSLNCGAIPENLIESELFGYEEGAFTGAQKGGKLGIFGLADKGTVFLDEIGEIPLHLQVKLLRVLQEKKIKKIGGANEKEVDVRIIAATNRNLEKKVKEGTFRQDLYYRLNVIPINVPPLRERKEDINALVIHFLDFYNQKYGKKIDVDETMLQNFRDYTWPGNVRELENVIERLVVTGRLFLAKEPSASLSRWKMQEVTQEHGELPCLYDYLEKVEQQLLLLNAKSKAKTTREIAKLLGVHQSTIVRKLNKYNL